jgi:molybdate/tungstate transport system permease protein
MSGAALFFKGVMAAGVLASALVILLPLSELLVQTSFQGMMDALKDPQVLDSLKVSFSAAGLAAACSFVMGTPFAYLLARSSFPGKKLAEGIVDLPIMIPHPVIGIAILVASSPHCWFGRLLQQAGIEVMGTLTGITAVMLFVGLPFYVNTVKNGFESVPERLEKVARSLGAPVHSVFFRVTLPLAWRSILVGLIMCMARALSEFGAVVIVAYHPMIAPVLIFDRFTAYGMRFAMPVAVLLIMVSLGLFVLLRLFSRPLKAGA